MVAVGSFAANIAPVADLAANERAAEITAFVLCEEGRGVTVDVELDQDGVRGEGTGEFRCTGRLDGNLVRVHSRGRNGFDPGSASARMTAEVRDRGEVVESFEWSREVTLAREER
jgi:hypothetical protein